MYSLIWKEFNVDLNKVGIYFKEELSENYDGLVCTEESLYIMFKNESISEEDIEIINNYWDNVTEETFLPAPEEIIKERLIKSIEFGNNLIFDNMIDFMIMGLIESGKARDVSNYFKNLERYIRYGYLPIAIQEINSLISTGIPSELSPYITETRLNETKLKIQLFIASII